MAKRGRRSIRNKRKSVKKYSSKRRSKTMRYLRGGVFQADDAYTSGNKPVTTSTPPLNLGVIYEDKDGGRKRRYLRGGVTQQVVSEDDERLIRKRTMREDDFDLCMKRCKANSTNYKKEVDPDGFYECIKKCSISANPIDGDNDEDDDDMGGGRRRYHRRKQSKSRSRKH